MKLVDYQHQAATWEEAMTRLRNLIDKAVDARQMLPIVIQLPVDLHGQSVTLKATVQSARVWRYEVEE